MEEKRLHSRKRERKEMEEKAVKAHTQLSDTEKRCKEAERDRKEGSEKVSTV